MDAIARLQFAWYSEDLDELVEISNTLEVEKPRGDIGRWMRYYSAYGYFRAASLAPDEYFDEYVEHCEDTSKKLVREDKEFSEALILQGACAALVASRRPLSALLAPRRAVRSFAKAERQAPENARLLLQMAEASVGRKALSDEFDSPAELLQRALVLFEQGGDADPLTPNWGEADAYLLMARLQQKAGNKLRARDAIEQALQIIPDSARALRIRQALRGQKG